MLSRINAIESCITSCASYHTEGAKNCLILDVVEELNHQGLLESYDREKVTKEIALVLILIIVYEVGEPELRDHVRVFFEVLGDDIKLLANRGIGYLIE
jgi:hypothetical protein